MKNNIKTIIAVVITAIICTTGGVVAANLASSKVSYDNRTSHSSKTTVQDAIDDLYDKVNNMTQLEDINPERSTTPHISANNRLYNSDPIELPVHGYDKFACQGFATGGYNTFTLTWLDKDFNTIPGSISIDGTYVQIPNNAYYVRFQASATNSYNTFWYSLLTKDSPYNPDNQ